MVLRGMYVPAVAAGLAWAPRTDTLSRLRPQCRQTDSPLRKAACCVARRVLTYAVPTDPVARSMADPGSVVLRQSPHKQMHFARLAVGADPGVATGGAWQIGGVCLAGGLADRVGHAIDFDMDLVVFLHSY